MVDAIGGYFGEEVLSGKFNAFIHEDGVLLNLGRRAFQYIYNSIPGPIEKIYMPQYTCPVMWHLLFWQGVMHQYDINRDLEIAEDIQLGENDYIVVNNYFGIKDAYVARMAEKYGNHLIVDNAQALYAPWIPDTYAFYSPRKFFGVPDGGVAYTAFNSKPVVCNEQDDSSDRLQHLQLRKEQGAEAGFATYQLNENKLDHLPMMKMSEYTHTVLCGIDYESAKDKRRANYKILHDALGAMNEMTLPEMDSFECPMVYPFVCAKKTDMLREALQKNRIYCATYWPKLEDWNADGSVERYFAHNIIPLPIDQRYGEKDMQRIIEIVCESMANMPIGVDSQILRAGGA